MNAGMRCDEVRRERTGEKALFALVFSFPPATSELEQGQNSRAVIRPFLKA